MQSNIDGRQHCFMYIVAVQVAGGGCAAYYFHTHTRNFQANISHSHAPLLTADGIMQAVSELRFIGLSRSAATVIDWTRATFLYHKSGCEIYRNGYILLVFYAKFDIISFLFFYFLFFFSAFQFGSYAEIIGIRLRQSVWNRGLPRFCCCCCGCFVHPGFFSTVYDTRVLVQFQSFNNQTLVFVAKCKLLLSLDASHASAVDSFNLLEKNFYLKKT